LVGGAAREAPRRRSDAPPTRCDRRRRGGARTRGSDDRGGRLSPHAGINAGPVIERDLDVFGQTSTWHRESRRSRVRARSSPAKRSSRRPQATGSGSNGSRMHCSRDFKALSRSIASRGLAPPSHPDARSPMSTSCRRRRFSALNPLISACLAEVTPSRRPASMPACTISDGPSLGPARAAWPRPARPLSLAGSPSCRCSYTIRSARARSSALILFGMSSSSLLRKERHGTRAASSCWTGGAFLV
jgi:hypothetical protein